MSPRMGEELALALALEGRTDAAQPEVKGLVAVADMLASLPEPEIDPAFAAALEQRLLNEGLEQAPVGRPHLTIVQPKPAAPAEEPARAPVVQMPSRRFVVRKSVVAVAACVAMSAFPAVAAAKSLPGSPFYGLKMVQQKIELAFARGPVADGMKHAEFAAEMASDAEQLAAFPEPDRGAIDWTLNRVASELAKASALVLDNTSDAATLNQLASLARRTATSTVAAAPAATDAKVAEVLHTTTTIFDATRAALGIDLGTQVAQIAASGPAPATVSAPSIDAGTTQKSSIGSSNPQTQQKKASKPSDSTEPKDGSDGGTGKAVDPAKRQACEAVFGAQLGNSLQYLSDVACGVDHG